MTDDRQENGWVTLLEDVSSAEALVLISLLRGAGIECRQAQETMGQLLGLGAGVLGKIRLEVRASQHALASELLDAKAVESEGDLDAGKDPEV